MSIKNVRGVRNARHLTLTLRQLHDLGLIVDGSFSPLDGFLNQVDYESVVDTSRLSNGKLWPIPIVLDVDDQDVPKIGEIVILQNTQEDKLARLTVESVFVPDKEKEALQVYGTLDKSHPGVAYLLNQTKNTYVGGKISALGGLKRLASSRDFLHLRKTPAELKSFFKTLKNQPNILPNILGFQTRNPIHRAHYELITRAAKKYNAHILIHPAVGPTKDGDIDYATRVRSYEKLIATRIPHATLSLLPLAMRMAGPREALWHALIRKNYGVTHFIIGRDHAGPGKDASGQPFYDPYAAQRLASIHADEIGITIISSPELAYDEQSQTYVSPDEINTGSKIASISGTEFRKLLRSGGTIPEWFSFPEVIEELRRSAIN